MPLLLKVAAGEVTDFDQCLCTLEFLDKMKPLQQVLKEKMPTTRRGNMSRQVLGAIIALLLTKQKMVYLFILPDGKHERKFQIIKKNHVILSYNVQIRVNINYIFFHSSFPQSFWSAPAMETSGQRIMNSGYKNGVEAE